MNYSAIFLLMFSITCSPLTAAKRTFIEKHGLDAALAASISKKHYLGALEILKENFAATVEISNTSRINLIKLLDNALEPLSDDDKDAIATLKGFIGDGITDEKEDDGEAREGE